MEIPGVGYFTVRSGLVAVNFQESLIQNTKVSYITALHDNEYLLILC